jgi:ubiquinone/menaquinone biosynthesis C-methylase UbiE
VSDPTGTPAANPLSVNFGKTSSDYAKFRPGFPDSFFERLQAHGIGGPKQRILDLGTGTGALAREFARSGAKVVGLDPSLEQIREAVKMDSAAKVNLDYVIATAEETGLSASSFDVVVAGQCWYWLDRAATMTEVERLLKPGGRLVICHFDWIPNPGNVVEATEALIKAYHPPTREWPLFDGNGIHAQWVTEIGRAGFRELELFAYDHEQEFSHEAWRGRIRASAGVGASLPAEAVARFDAELAELLRARFPADPLQVPHRVFALIGKRPR